MLNLMFSGRYRTCDGATRREFLKVGALGTGALALPQLLQARAEAAAGDKTTKETSIIWLWLGGGPTHIETFDPKMTAPSEYRSVTGDVKTSLPGVTIGGTFPKMAKVVDKMALVRSFHHSNSGHGGGTHWVMTGYNNKKSDNGGLPNRPSFGSILARVRGSNHPTSGIPTYIRTDGIGSDGPAFLGPAYAPFDHNGQAKKNMTMVVAKDRIDDRKSLLRGLDRINRQVDQTGLMDGLSKFEQQAFDLLFGSAAKAFDIKAEDPKTVANYGNGLGQKLLMARRLCEAGAGFVTLSYHEWDMHGKIANSMKSRSPQMDQGVAALLEDLHERGMSDNVMLVISGEFGRTPKVNKNAGRDHWAPLSTLALAGGGLKMGQVVGRSAPKLDVPAENPITPQDLMATVFHVLGIDQKMYFHNLQGRPTPMLTDGKVIRQLI